MSTLWDLGVAILMAEMEKRWANVKFTWKKNCKYEWAKVPQRPKFQALPYMPWEEHFVLFFCAMVWGTGLGGVCWDFRGNWLVGWILAVAAEYLLFIFVRLVLWLTYFRRREKRYYKRLMKEYGKDPVAMSMIEGGFIKNLSYESIYKMLNSFY